MPALRYAGAFISFLRRCLLLRCRYFADFLSRATPEARLCRQRFCLFQAPLAADVITLSLRLPLPMRALFLSCPLRFMICRC